MIARHFVVTTLETGAVVGRALLCTEARYLAVRWQGTLELDRRSVSAPARWKTIEAEVRDGWSKGLVSVASAVYASVVPERERRRLQVQHVTSVLLDVAPVAATSALDEHLNEEGVSDDADRGRERS